MKIKIPNWRQFTRSLFRKIKRIIEKKPLLVDKETREKRIAICTQCENYMPNCKQCGFCGCFISLKASFYDEACPHPTKNKWLER